MEYEQQSRGGAARWLAPLAIVAVALVTLIVVSGSDVMDEPRETAPGASSGARETPPGGDGGGGTGKKAYVVKPGDTLSSIAVATGVSVQQLQALNPDIDPQELAAGERLKLR